ncbi:MAG: HDIG domain-containing protein [Gemmatimonadota bacterium]|nr:HDIG domain-containing protein [Gemmatimonadota bacterium]MDH5195859.1 HDIG domain-containing protein [Gemmatimonadota bacterium]
MNNHRRFTVPVEPPAPELPHHIGFHALRWLPVVGLAMLTVALYPGAGRIGAPPLDPGQVALEDVVAPFDFDVRKTPAELVREGDQLEASVRPIYQFRQAGLDSALTTATRLFAALDTATAPGELEIIAQAHGLHLSADEAAFLFAPGQRTAFRKGTLDLLRRELGRGVASSAVLQAEASRIVVVQHGQTERVVDRGEVMDNQRFLEARIQGHPAPNSTIGDQIYLQVLILVFRPTLVFDRAETDSLRRDIRANVDTVRDQVRTNELIVGAHQVVTTDAHDRLDALRAELIARGGGGRSLRAVVGQFLTAGLVLSVFWLLLLLYRRESYVNLRHIAVFTTIFTTVIGGAALNARFLHPGAELIPIPFAAMLLTALFSGRVAMLGATTLAVLVASQPTYQMPSALYLALIGGVAAAIGMRVVRRRTQILTTMAIVLVAFGVTALAVGMQQGWEPQAIGISALRGAVNAVASAALVGVALPLFEALGRITTDVTLLELSDPMRPLLRRLATEAPGTYAHSVAMANLCESACNAIGANGLLARVGCYYHDVGKLAKPQFFVENQMSGGNPHDKLKPEVSAQLIRSHVKEGVALAEEARLPEAVTAFIPEHHGTAEITYFLERARARGDSEISPDAFRYPGPRPRSVETAVAMLADGVEAALRVLDDPSPEKIRDAIDHLTLQRVESGQLDDAPLTLSQLERVKEEFVRVLAGVHHNRIDYPANVGGISADWKATPPA